MAKHSVHSAAPEPIALDDIDTAIRQLQSGGLVIAVDDEDRENEGDFILAADYASEVQINFMVTHGRGLVCQAIRAARAGELQLKPMVDVNSDAFTTAFTVSVDAAKGTTTGISAADRAASAAALIDPLTRPADLRRPGHLFPLVAREGGVLIRPGHTEAAVDLAELAGLTASGLICEILNEDGTMARLPELRNKADEWGIPLISIAGLIEYRRKKSRQSIRRVSDARLPTEFGEFTLAGFEAEEECFALIMGEAELIDGHKTPLVRIHSECLTGESFGSLRCDCDFQLRSAMEHIGREGSGVIVYLRQEGRGIGLMNKIRAYQLQDGGMDTFDANTHQGLPADAREYGSAAAILGSLGIQSCRLMTNNPDKVSSLEENGIRVDTRIPIEMHPGKHSRGYLRSKKLRFGHSLEYV